LGYYTHAAPPPRARYKELVRVAVGQRRAEVLGGPRHAG